MCLFMCVIVCVWCVCSDVCARALCVHICIYLYRCVFYIYIVCVMYTWVCIYVCAHVYCTYCIHCVLMGMSMMCVRESVRVCACPPSCLRADLRAPQLTSRSNACQIVANSLNQWPRGGLTPGPLCRSPP